jgi:hypothetical protein
MQFIPKKFSHLDREFLPDLYPLAFAGKSVVTTDSNQTSLIMVHVPTSNSRNKCNIQRNKKLLNISIQKYLSTFLLWTHIKSCINIHIILEPQLYNLLRYSLRITTYNTLLAIQQQQQMATIPIKSNIAWGL